MSTGQLIVLLLTGIVLLVVLTAPITPLQSTTHEPFTITVENPNTDNWGDISASWNDGKTSITIPLYKTGSGNFRNNKTLMIFNVKPNPPPGSSITDFDTIHVEILNASATIGGRYLFSQSRGIFFANISDPDGTWSGNDYRSDHTFLYQHSGEFKFAFKVDSGTAYSASSEFNYVGEFVKLQIHFFDNEGFSKTYDLKFTCLEV